MAPHRSGWTNLVRLSLVAYRMDFNYSLYSYQRFFSGSTEADIYAKW